MEKNYAVQEGREGAEGRRAQVHVQLEGRGSRMAALLYEKAAASTMQRASWREDGKAVPRKKKLQPGGGQQEVSKGNGGSALCKSLRSMASAQPHSVGQEAVLRGYNSKKYEQTPKQRWKLLGRKKSLARARKTQVKRLCLRESRNKGMS